MRWLVVLVAVLSTSPALAQLHPTGRAVVTMAIEKVIRPGFAGFAEATAGLRDELPGLCAQPSQSEFDEGREAFRQVVLAWSRIELFRFGPLMTENRSDRILFWPDRKGIALRQVQQILAESDEAATDPVALAGKSVAVQGLGALEFLLFGAGAETLATAEGNFRCRYAKTIATLLSDTAGQMRAEWDDPDGISKRMIFPTEADADYRSPAEVQQELIGAMAHGVEAIRDQRILPFLGREGEAPKPRSALFWRSNLTVPSIVANFEGLKALLVGSDIWEYAPTEQFWIGQQAIAAFDAATAAGAGVVGTVEQAVGDAGQRQALGEMVTASQTLGKLTGEDLPAALGLSVGFSSLDGD